MAQIFLTIVSGVTPKKYALNASLITIGSGTGNSINLPISSVAQTYCSIKRTDNNKYILEDSQKQGNIYINGIKTLSQQLVSGDTIQIGSIIMKYEVIGEMPTANKIAVGAKTSAAGTGQPIQQRAQTQTSQKMAPATNQPRTAQNNPAINKIKGVQPAAAKKNPNEKANISQRKTPTPQRKGMDKKQIKTFLIAASIIGVIIAVIFLFKGKEGPTQQELTKELVEAVETAKKLINDKKIVDADAYIEKIIEDPRYKEADRLPDVKQFHGGFHDRAGDEKKALVEVTKFKEKFNKAYEAKTIALADAEQLLDECKSLIGKYSYSDQGNDLKQMLERIEKTVKETEKAPGTDELAKIKDEVSRLLGAGDNNYNAAIKFLEGSKAQYAKDMFMDMGIQSEIDIVNRKAKSEFQKIKEKSTQLKKENKLAEANKILNEAIPRFKGTDYSKDIEDFQKQIKD